jgi:hypothetical protein
VTKGWRRKADVLKASDPPQADIALQTSLDPNFAVFPLRRAEHRGSERTRLADCLRAASFRETRTPKPGHDASIMLAGKAHGQARRAAID